jgi:hypothetical protein
MVWQSYKRLPKRQRIYIGLVGIAIGLAGPTLMEKLREQLFGDQESTDLTIDTKGRTDINGR